MLVEPGTYDDFHFCGKAVTVIASSSSGGRIITGKVEFTDSEGSGSVLGSLEEGKGFTITGSSTYGIEIDWASPQILGNTIENADDSGIHVDGGSPLIQKNTISNNGDLYFDTGGGIHLNNASATLKDNTICNNRASHGGGIYISGEYTVSVEECRIEGNTTSGHGGGIHATGGSSSLTISRTVLRNNDATKRGGGIYTNNSGAIAGNGCGSYFNLAIDNSLIFRNKALHDIEGEGGGTVVGSCSEVDIVNCTITENFAQDEGGGIQMLADNPILDLDNSIVWANQAENGGSQIGMESEDNSISVEYSDVEGGWTGTENKDEDPAFCDPYTNNFRLATGSPVINEGNNSLVVDEANGDYEHNDRTVGTVDMGAYEDQGTGCAAGTGLLRSCCESASLVSSSPVTSKRDVRQPHPLLNNALSARQGIGSPNTYTNGPEPITITLSSSIEDAQDPSCWSLCETGIETVEGISALQPNRIKSITEQSSGVYEILLHRPISGGHFTAIQYLGASGFTSYSSLPGDVNGSGQVAGADLTNIAATSTTRAL